MMRILAQTVVGVVLCCPGTLMGQATSLKSSAGIRFEEWGRQLGIHPGVMTEMARFQKGGRHLDLPLASAQARKIRATLLARAQTQFGLLETEGCRPAFDVTFPEAMELGVPDPGPVLEGFLGGMVRTESVACYETGASPQEALDLYTSPSFRMEAESRIERMWTEGESTCIRTGGVPLLLSPTEVCNRVTRFLEDDLAVEHSQVIENPNGSHEQPVYFKESLKIFLEVPGGLAFHYVNFSRSVDLGRPTRWVARGKIRESQERQVEALRRRIGG